MQTLKNKAAAFEFFGLLSDSLLKAVRASHTQHPDHFCEPLCKAVEAFNARLSQDGDLEAAAMILVDGLVCAQTAGLGPDTGRGGASPSLALVNMLIFAVSSPVIAQHRNGPPVSTTRH